MSDAFTLYEKGLREFQQRLGKQHERLLDFINYEHQLRTNIQQTRDDGETPILSADRNRIVRQLNALALETVGVSFNELCTSQPPTTAKRAGCIGRIGSRVVGLRVWYGKLPPAPQVAIIVALIGLVGTLGAAFIRVIPELRSGLTPIAAIIATPTSTVTPTSTCTPSPTPTTTPTSSTLTLTPIPTPPLISTPVYTYPFYVYRDSSSPDNHFSFWEGIWEDGDSIKWGGQIDYGYSNDCRSDSTCMRIAYTAVGPKYWVGINWLHPQGNHGKMSEGFDLRKATRLTFWARGEEGGEIVTFDMGGLGRNADTCAPTAPYPDSVCPSVWITRELSTVWQQYSIDLAGKDLSHVIRGFFVSIGGGSDRTIYLDEIRYEKGPLAPLTTPDCRGVQVSHLELDLVLPTGQEVYPDEKGVITLTHDAIRGLVNLSGQAILTGTNVADCTCYWEGKIDVDDPWRPINSLIGDCRFSIELPDELPDPDQVMAICHLKLTVGEVIRLFTVRVQ